MTARDIDRHRTENTPERRASRPAARPTPEPDRARRAVSDDRAPLADRAVAPYSRERAAGRYGRVARERGRRRTIALAVAGALVAIVVIAVAAVACTVGSIGSRLNEGVSEDTKATLADQRADAQAAGTLTDTSPFYMLLLGVDASDNRRYGDEAGFYGDAEELYRTDTIILARIDPGQKKVALVSVHRDTYWPIDGVYQKINNAYSLGGVSKTIDVISGYAGVPIIHYAQVDMTGLSALIDALGGVEIDVPYEIDDEYTGYLAAGLQTLDGEQALIFARSRHAYDDLGDGDRYRAAHQRVLIAAVAEKLMSASPTDMVNAISTVADFVTTDLTLDQIVSLAMAFRGIDMEHDVYSTMNPTYNEYIDGVSYEITIEPDWTHLMELVDKGLRPDADSGYISVANDINNPDYTAVATAPSQTRVVVKDASGGTGRAAEVIATLQATGWAVEDGGVANITLDQTTVVYKVAVQQANAETVASQLGATCEPAGTVWGVAGDVMVVVGAY